MVWLVGLPNFFEKKKKEGDSSVCSSCSLESLMPKKWDCSRAAMLIVHEEAHK